MGRAGGRRHRSAPADRGTFQCVEAEERVPASVLVELDRLGVAVLAAQWGEQHERRGRPQGGAELRTLLVAQDEVRVHVGGGRFPVVADMDILVAQRDERLWHHQVVAKGGEDRPEGRRVGDLQSRAVQVVHAERAVEREGGLPVIGPAVGRDGEAALAQRIEEGCVVEAVQALQRLGVRVSVEDDVVDVSRMFGGDHSDGRRRAGSLGK